MFAACRTAVLSSNRAIRSSINGLVDIEAVPKHTRNAGCILRCGCGAWNPEAP